jgi:hypothetical protein
MQESILAPLRSGTSKGTPRWVQWDKPPRNPDFAKEAFYIAREDGMVIYVERGQADTLDIVEAGSWPYPIDTAFACLDVDNSEFARSYPDVLISGGTGTDGHLCRVGAWPKEYAFTLPYSETNVFASLDSLPNWAPLTDMSITQLPGLHSQGERVRASIFITRGETPHGEISELRRGLKALVDDSFGGMKGCTGVWLVDYGSGTLSYESSDIRQHYVTFIVAFPLESIVIRALRTQLQGSASQNDPGVAWHGEVWEKTQLPAENDVKHDDIIRDEETLSVCIWSDQFTIQVTRQEARILRRPVLEGVDSFSFPNLLLGAATKPGFPFIAATFREDGQAVLDIHPVSNDGAFATGGDGNPRFNLPCDPTCIELMHVNGAPHIFVGTVDSGICLLSLNKAGSLTCVFDERLENNSLEKVHMVCESAVLLSSRGRQQLVCGTRNGFMVFITLETQTARKFSLSSTSRRC